MEFNDSEINALINNIKHQLSLNTTLSNELEMVIKHINAYNKIIKTHVEQLKNVLALDHHQNKNLDNANLSPIITQLIQIFDKLQDSDLQQLEELYSAAIHWKKEKISTPHQPITSEATL